MPTIPPLLVSDAERAELQRRVRAHTTPQRAVKRARVVLLAADGVPNRQIAPLVGMDPHTVAQWRRRFEAERLAGLEDRQRPGRPLVYGHDDRLRIVAQVTQEPPDPASHWSHAQLAGALADIGISASQIGRILADLDLKPHRVRGWITRSDDPTFWERAADVCGLYLVPPTNALVLSVDEKTGIGARSRTRPLTRPAPGRPSRQEHEYVRHGTATLLAALDVHRGGVVQAIDVDRNTAANFIAFLDDLDTRVPTDLEVHLVLDNGSSHIANATRWWFVDHPRFHAHYTPTHASWLNQVELFFSILARRLLKHGEFASVEDLVAKVMAFIADYNRTAKPFRWTYEGRPLKASWPTSASSSTPQAPRRCTPAPSWRPCTSWRTPPGPTGTATPSPPATWPSCCVATRSSPRTSANSARASRGRATRGRICMTPGHAMCRYIRYMRYRRAKPQVRPATAP